MLEPLERLNVALAGRYHISRELGRGGMATVYLAEDLRHRRPVALKVLRPELAAALGPERFLREIEIAGRLNHPHILPLFDSGNADGSLYYVMPYVEGQSLRDRLKTEKQLSVDESVRIALELADGLSAAHDAGIVHRDIKPENVLLSGGHALVADFGIARAVSAAGGPQLTETGLAVGTPEYMSPEQARGDVQLDARTDIYALGCVLYEMLAGDPPFTGSSAHGVMARKALDPVPRLQTVRVNVPLSLEAVVLRALATVPADRFATSGEFADALRGASLVPEPTWHRTWIRVALALGGLATALWAVRLFLGPPATAEIDRMAVLPLANLTGDVEQAYFVDGMHDALIAELAGIGALTVISRQSVLRYRNTEKSMPEIANELGVQAVIEGSVFRVGDSVRITVQLIQALPAERHIWAETYQKDLTNVLALHREVAAAIAQQVRVKLTPREASRLASARPVNPAAYDAWLKGFHHMTRLTGPDTDACIRYARDAAAIDAAYAPAYGLLAACYNNITFVTPSAPREVFEQAKAAARRALALDEDMHGPHVGLGWALAVSDWDWSGAWREFHRAIALNPGAADAHALYGFFLSWISRFEDALLHARRAEELDPVSPAASQNVAMVLYLARRYGEAVRQARRTLAIDSNFMFAYHRLHLALDGTGMYEEALAAAQRAAKLAGANDMRRTGFLGYAYARAGLKDEARVILARLLKSRENAYVPPTTLAAVYTGLGETERALYWLEQGYNDRDGDMVVLQAWPLWDPLRSEPRFAELVRRMRFPD